MKLMELDSNSSKIFCLFETLYNLLKSKSTDFSLIIPLIEIIYLRQKHSLF